MNPDPDSWIRTALMNPLQRQPVMNIYGPKNSGKTWVIKFLNGYFLPYKPLLADAVVKLDYAAGFEGIVLCILYNKFDMRSVRRYLLPEEINTGTKYFPNYTQWIAESSEPIDGCLNVELTSVDSRPIVYVNPRDRGIEVRRMGVIPDLRSAIHGV